MYRKFRNVPIFEDFSPICPYFLGFRFGKYDSDTHKKEEVEPISQTWGAGVLDWPLWQASEQPPQKKEEKKKKEKKTNVLGCLKPL